MDGTPAAAEQDSENCITLHMPADRTDAQRAHPSARNNFNQ